MTSKLLPAPVAAARLVAVTAGPLHGAQDPLSAPGRTSVGHWAIRQ